MKNRNLPEAWWAMPRVFDDFFNDSFLTPSRLMTEKRHSPAVNIMESPESFVVEMQIPGWKKEDFDISLQNGVLTVSGDVRNEDQKEEEGYTYKEFSSRSFQRSFTLPKGKVSEDEIKATYENGILHLDIPKLPEAKPKEPKQISVS
ncbi:MAG: Hsp20/alpha crystallin family protein [Bacteroidota bacterium]|nr:Hsp20/alpha crystallin family protein [Bacteroidota bacterium]MDX5447090.1 Hsp20/alpha crystallin family protein [Bacteroidota bacterium]MDX5504613.1 Hsp20/alpha crystallin family protein [Bacteroidota bacterium]